MSPSGPVTVCTTRTVKVGREAEFELALHDFIQRSLSLSGQHGVHIMRPAPGSGSREYGIVRKFADREAVAAFQNSADYQAWSRSVVDLTEGDPTSTELCGLESWFTLPGAPLRALPKWKMAAATLLGVIPVAALLNVVLPPLIASWNPLVGSLAFNGCMVALLTWVVMPLITRALHRWLHA